MKAEESNFFIIDKQGIIRYKNAGKINPNQFGKIKKLLFTLVKTKLSEKHTFPKIHLSALLYGSSHHCSVHHQAGAERGRGDGPGGSS
jgi:hypothetical protein